MNTTNKGFKTAIIYVLIGIAWTVFSRKALQFIHFKLDPEIFLALDGTLFIVFTGLLLGILIHRNDKKNRAILDYLKNNESEIVLLMNNTEESFILIDKDLNIVSFNKQFSIYYKRYLNKDVHKGDSILDCAQDNRKFIVKKIYNRVLDGETIFKEIKIRGLNGESLTFLNHYKPALDKEGKIIGAFITSSDITEKKQAEQQLIAGEKRFRALVENVGDLISLTESEGKIVYLSPAFEKITGFTLNEMKGKPAFEIMHPDYFEESKSILEELLQKPGVPIPRTNRFLHKNGSYIWVEGITINLLEDENVKAIVANYRDITERKTRENEREFDHNNLHALINNTNDLMWSVSKDGKLITSNRAFDDLVKFMSGNQVTKGSEILTEGFSEEQLGRWEKFYQRAFSGETFTIIEQSDFPVEYTSEISFYPILKGDEIIGTACHSRDITERKKFEKKLEDNTSELLKVKKELEHNSARLKQAQAIAHIGSWEVNFASNISVWSDEAYRIYGLPPAEHKLSFESWLTFIHPEDLDYVKKEIKKTQETLSDLSYYHRIIRADGVIRHVNSQSRFEFNAEGKPIGLYGTVHDITEAKEAEETIIVAKERYDIVAKATSDVIWDWDLVKNTTQYNHGICEVFGYRKEEVPDEAGWWEMKLHPDDRIRCIKTESEFLEKKDSNLELEYRFQCADGSYKRVIDKSIALRDAKGKALRMIGAMQDITQRKETELELKNLNKKLETRAEELVRSNEELEQFAYIASHDLQEPLRMVNSFLTLLENKYKNKLDDKAKQYIFYASDGAIRMRKIILDLLEYSRVGRKNCEMGSINTSDLLSEVVQLNKAIIDEKNALIQWKDLPTVNGNGSDLLQVFQNLLGNSLKYQQKNKRPVIEIKAEEKENHWLFSFTDNGIGIEPRFFDKIFVVFQRLHNRSEYSGTGIGLAICKKIVENYQGKIWVESVPGSGSTFYFTLAKVPELHGKKKDVPSDTVKLQTSQN